MRSFAVETPVLRILLLLLLLLLPDPLYPIHPSHTIHRVNTMPGKPALDSKGAQLILRGQTPDEIKRIQGFKYVCRKDKIVMRKELLQFVDQFLAQHHWPPGNPQRNIDEEKWSETEQQVREDEVVESEDDLRTRDVPIDSKYRRKVDLSEGYWEKCEECKGVGTVPPFGSTCTHCNGFKRIWVAVPPKPPNAVLKRRGFERAVR